MRSANTDGAAVLERRGPAVLWRFARLGRDDARHLRAHLLRLHPDDLANRFIGSRQRQLAGRHARSIDWHRSVLLGCWVGRSLRGVCELHPIQGNRAEIAISVERRFQRRGMGAELLRRTLLLARNRGSTVLELRCLADNQRVRRLIGRFQGQISYDSPEASATIHTLPPTAATLVSEMVDRAGVLGGSLIRLWLRSAGRGWAGHGRATAAPPARRAG